tara:strand:- start:5857 stop:6459 length:603 start_codon:yes stop_codon:yes gene_type:complete
MAKTNNMEIWESVETTDPTYTKKVNQRGGFTAIGAQYQLMRATETFGPMGKGWGVKAEHIQKWEDVGLAVYEATLWYVVKDKEYYIPIHSSIKYHTSGRVDDDFYKKVATDALTKGLSKLGFNADVFMGKFDDNKYVNQLKRTHKQPDVDYKSLISKAADGLNEEDKKTVMSNIDKVNSLNVKAILNRIKEMESSYKDKS